MTSFLLDNLLEPHSDQICGRLHGCVVFVQHLFCLDATRTAAGFGVNAAAKATIPTCYLGGRELEFNEL